MCTTPHKMHVSHCTIDVGLYGTHKRKNKFKRQIFYFTASRLWTSLSSIFNGIVPKWFLWNPYLKKDGSSLFILFSVNDTYSVKILLNQMYKKWALQIWPRLYMKLKAENISELSQVAMNCVRLANMWVPKVISYAF